MTGVGMFAQKHKTAIYVVLFYPEAQALALKMTGKYKILPYLDCL
jgi:hypothetical protein